LFLLVLLPVSLGVFWMVNREPSTITLKYGELKQVLRSPGVTFQNVRVDPTEIRGEIVTRDPVIDGKDNGEQTQSPVPFRTSRLGLQLDQDLQNLLDKYVGPGYQGGEDDKGVGSLIVHSLLMVALVVGGFLMIRWMAGGSSPLTFGRSRHRLYAQKDNKVTFAD